jgi:hypothetical protein
MGEYGHELTSTAGKELTDQRHDGIKWCIHDMMNEAGLRFECEALNLFAAHISQHRHQDDEEDTRQRQGLIPDFLLHTKPTVSELMDVKTISRCQTRYEGFAPVSRALAVERRQGMVPSEYRRKAKNADRKYNGTIGDAVGPVERELASYGRVRGLVSGAYGEMSKDVVWLVRHCTNAMAARHWRSMGARNVKEAKAALVTKTRKRLGIEAVRGHAILKLERLKQELGRANMRQARERRRESQNRHRERRKFYYHHYFGSRTRGSDRWRE